MVQYSVSIIVPVYNNENYISQCLDSLLQQSLRSIEILVINDGSTDKTAKILAQYEEKYSINTTTTNNSSGTSSKKSKKNIITDLRPSLKIIHQKNQGCLLSRKNGLALAQGEYLGFVDSDDWVSPDMYQKLYASATQGTIGPGQTQTLKTKITKSDPIDIVSCGFVNVDHEGKILSTEIFPNTFNQVRHNRILADNPPSWCNSIFAKRLFDNKDIQFISLHRGEDLVIVPRLFYYANQILMLREALYYYRNISTQTPIKNSSIAKISINLKKDLEGIHELFKVAEILAEFYKDKNTEASDLISYTTKFPDWFNRYNFKHVIKFAKHFNKNNQKTLTSVSNMSFQPSMSHYWLRYFTQLLKLISTYPKYYLALLKDHKIENAYVLSCFQKTFKNQINGNPNSEKINLGLINKFFVKIYFLQHIDTIKKILKRIRQLFMLPKKQTN